MREHVKTPKRRYPRGSFPNSGSRTTLALLLEQQQKIELGKRIKWLRDNSVETSRTIARYCDVSDEAVRNWIAGKGIKWDNAEKVADLFKTDPGWIWRGEGKPPEGYPEEDRSSTPDLFTGPHADQLDRIEEKLDELLERAAPTAPDAEDVPDGVPPLPDPQPEPAADDTPENRAAG